MSHSRNVIRPPEEFSGQFSTAINSNSEHTFTITTKSKNFKMGVLYLQGSTGAGLGSARAGVVVPVAIQGSTTNVSAQFQGNYSGIFQQLTERLSADVAAPNVNPWTATSGARPYLKSVFHANNTLSVTFKNTSVSTAAPIAVNYHIWLSQ